MPRRVILFLFVAAAQLAVPAWMLVGHERVRKDGAVFLFRTAPVDPRDPFRGEYVRLNFEAQQGSWTAPDAGTMEYGQRNAFALLDTDSLGYARITALVDHAPDNGPYLPIRYWTMGDEGTVNSLELPFDRYYLEEGDGPKTEALLAPDWSSGSPSTPLPAHAVVRILHGQAVITDLVVGERSIHDWLKDPPKEASPAATSVPSGS